MDALEAFGIEPETPAPLPELSETAARIVARLGVESSSADVLARVLALDPGALSAALTELELAGAVAERDGFFRLTRHLGCSP